MQKSFNVALDLKRTLPIEDITMIEGDTGNRLIISVVDDGHPVDLTGCFVIVAFQRKDCVMWQSSANPDVIISDNTVTVDVLTESISADETYCEIQIYSDVERTELVTTSRFVIYVNKGIINDSAVQATNDYPILSQLVEDVEQIRSEFLEALERLQQIIDNLGGSGGSIEMYYLSFSIRSNAWPDEPPYKISLTNSDKVRYNDYLIAGVSWLSDDVNENIAVNEGWNKISEINPIDGGLEFTCLLDKPTCDLSLVFMGFRTLNANGYCYLTGHPQLSSGGSGGILAKHAYTHALNGNDPVTPDSIGASNAPYFLTITISASGFNGSYTQRIIDLDEIKGTDYIIASPLLLGGSTSDLSNEIKSWNLINKIAVSQGALYIYCYDELPTHDITVQLIGTHANMERGHCVLAGHSGHSNGSNIGHGIPAGGTAGQTLVKRTSEDYDVDWLTPTGGGGGTPYAHASTHAAGGSDPITPASIRAAPTSHASNTTGYGAGNGTNYGHLKLSDSVNSTLGISGGTAAAPVAVKAAYDLAASRAPANQAVPKGGTAGQVLAKLSNDDNNVGWITSSGGESSSPSPYYLTVSVLPTAWTGTSPPYTATMTELLNVQTGDYIIAGITPTSNEINECIADYDAWHLVSKITPSTNGLSMVCYEHKPDRPLSLILVGWHTSNSIGYCYLTGHASADGGGTGTDGREIELRKGTTAIEWRYIGDTTWQTLVPLADITGPQGPQGARGATGATGPQGPAGQGIPTGGTAGQVLVKRSGTDYDTNWATPTSGGGGTPYAHASTHATGGSDPITPTAIGAAASGHNHAGTYAPVSHAIHSQTYGVGNGTLYGHTKLSAATNSTLGVSGGTAATPSAVKAAYDLAAGKADADHNHDDRYALIGHTHSGSGTSVEYKTITVPLDGWDAGVPCTQTISVAGVATTDYISAKYTSNAINTNERVADHAAYCCVTDGTPTPGGVLLTCWHERPTRDIRMVLRVEHGGTTGYMVMTGQARPSGGVKTANGSVITADQTISVTGLGFRPSMVSFVGSSGKTTITSGHGVDTGSTTAAWYADASGPGNVGTFSPSDDGFVLTVQGADVKTLNVGWQAVGD